MHTAGILSGILVDQSTAVLATLLHSAGYVLVMGMVAVVVYEWLGLRLLRSVWFNVDLVWAAALLLTAGLTPFM